MTNEPVILDVVMEVRDGNDEVFYTHVPLTKSFVAFCVKLEGSMEELGIEVAQIAEKFHPELKTYSGGRAPFQEDLLVRNEDNDKEDGVDGEEEYHSLPNGDCDKYDPSLRLHIRKGYGLFLVGYVGGDGTEDAYSTNDISVHGLKMILEGIPVDQAPLFLNHHNRVERTLAKMALEGRRS